MELLTFTRNNLGRSLDFDGAYGAQCVDLVQVYLRDVFSQPPWPGATAAEMAGPRPKWGWIANAPTNYPPAGAIVVWGPDAAEGISSAGHIAIALAASSSVLLTLDQNWPEGAPVSIVLHDYGGVLGWHVPYPRPLR